MEWAPRRWLVALGVVPALLGALPPPRADAEPIALTYQVFEGCPDRAAFMAELAVRTPRVRSAQPGEPARVVRVAIEREAGVTRGHLSIENPDRSSTQRHVTGADCAEVSSALALVMALIIDPRALENAASPDPGPSAADAGPPVAAVAEVASASPPAAQPARPAPMPEATPVSAMADVAEGRAPAAPSPPQRAPVAGIQGHALVAPVRSTAWGGGAFIGFDDARKSALAPSARLAGVAVTASDGFESGVGARFTWFLARPELCPLRPRLLDELRLELCAAIDLGVLSTRGRGVNHPERSARFWLAPGAGARFAWAFSAPWALELGGGVSVPVRRYPFGYETGAGEQVEVDAVSRLVGTLNAGAAYHFP